MVVESQVKDPSGLGKLSCEANVFLARRWITARMVMNEDES
jgi:hypothetical protein